MFGGSDECKPEPQFFMDHNHFQYDPNVLPQLQLFGCSSLNFAGNEQAAAPILPVKRCLEIVPNCSQQNESGLAGRGLMNPNSVSTGLRLSYEEERNNSSVTCSGEGMRGPVPGIFALGDSLKLEIDKQREEFDNYMIRQEANLMKGMRELKHKQTVRLLNSLEKGVAKKLQEKEIEIENMKRQNKELADKIVQLSADVQCWHYKSKYNESVANTLRSNLQQAIAQGSNQAREGFGDNEVDDAASYANFGNSSFQNQMPKCRACRSNQVSMLLIPCKHLCLCKDCEVSADICPICQVMKTASVEVFVS